MEPVVFARQPIFDADLKAVGYELLYRRPNQDRARFLDGNHATARVVVGALVEVGLDEVCGGVPAFINVTRQLLCSERLMSLPPDRVVLEVLEHTVIDDQLVAAMQRYLDEGYVFALDDFSFRDGIERLLPMATYVKLDVMASGLAGVAEHVKQLEPWSVTLVAEKVETREEFRECRALGCDLFQGYFLAKPSTVQRSSTAPARQTLLRLVARLYDPDVSLQEIEQIVSSDVGLSYRILRIINSAYYHLPREVNSVRQAVALLGLRFTRTWVSLIALADLGDAPTEVVTSAAVRAKMCERLAQLKRRDDPDAYYLSGLFSMLDAILDQPLKDVVGSLPLTPDIKQALLLKDGPIGQALRCVLAHEQANWGELDFEDLDDGEIQQAYLEALAWAFRTREALWAAIASG
ncbi:MAG: HDOD domain-containing protein [Myxococcales bacterium]|nr:HDOD domain-containing protein [Myxococcales bacterium]